MSGWGWAGASFLLLASFSFGGGCCGRISTRGTEWLRLTVLFAWLLCFLGLLLSLPLERFFWLLSYLGLVFTCLFFDILLNFFNFHFAPLCVLVTIQPGRGRILSRRSKYCWFMFLSPTEHIHDERKGECFPSSPTYSGRSVTCSGITYVYLSIGDKKKGWFPFCSEAIFSKNVL